MGFLIRVLVNALAIWLATVIVPGIEARGATRVVGAALVLGVINAIVRPILLVLTLPVQSWISGRTSMPSTTAATRRW